MTGPDRHPSDDAVPDIFDLPGDPVPGQRPSRSQPAAKRPERPRPAHTRVDRPAPRQDSPARASDRALPQASTSSPPEPPPTPSELLERLSRCTIADERRLHARIKSLLRVGRHHDAEGRARQDEQLRDIARQIDRSAARVDWRRTVVPSIQYPADLPVAARKVEIMAAVAAHQVTVVCGATGSGKTTQIPKMLLELGRGVRGFIGHTQPRRIAARAVGARIAQELGGQLGGIVGYKVRFTDQTSERSLVKLMTDGILLAETQHDPYLSMYDTIIIDEAHERSLNIDFLLGYLRQLLPRRPDLKVVITSATIDPASFAEHFALPGNPKPPVIEVSGRTYPVDIVYRPLEAQHEDEEDRDLEQGILHAVDELSQGPNPEGDILVFLPGEREIRETAEALRKHPLRPAHRVDVIPLFARLSTDEQNRVFKPEAGRRRIVLATNVAETSLTVPGIKYVIDSGLARISRYSPRIKVQRLPIEPISRASADQRSGRSGRTSAGICIRLYTPENFEARPAFTDPEILRTNLASVILQMKALDLGDIEDFPFLLPPESRSVRDGYDTLLEINALEGGGLRNDLTDIGRRLARLPIDPRIARMLIAAQDEHCLSEVLVIAAALSTQDPRDRPIDKADAADTAHGFFREEGSDFLGFVKLWKALHAEQKRLSGGQFRKWCHAHFLSYIRFREWHDTHAQLRELMIDMGGKPVDKPARPDQVHRALMSGLLSSLGRKNESASREQQMTEGEYDGARGLRFGVFPGSVLFKKSPKWVMAAEIVKTTRTYARHAAQIDPKWIEPVAAHLVKRTYQDPHWDADLARASAFETVTLYGLEIVKRRTVDYSAIDPVTSRALFIQHGLVGGEYLTEAPFFEHNHALTTRVKQLQERSRKADLLSDTTTRYSFYDKRLPAEVASPEQFEDWRRRAEQREPGLLEMKKEDVLAPGVVEPALEQFPESVTLGGRSYLLEYKHDPGDPDDGVTITVNVDDLARVPSARLDWLVPGLLPEKIETLIRELPKHLRAALVPVPQTAAQAFSKLKFAQGDLLDALGSAVASVARVVVERAAWRADALPPHLRMNVRVLDAKGKLLAKGRDLGALRRELAGQAEVTMVRLSEGPCNRAGVLIWDFGPLPASFEERLDGRTLTLHPALHDEGEAEAVSIRPFTELPRAKRAHAAGLRKLFAIQTRRECRSLIKTMPGVEKLLLFSKAMPETADSDRFVRELADLTAFVAFERATPGLDLWGIRTQEAFEPILSAAWPLIGKSGREVFSLAEAILAEYRSLVAKLDRVPPDWGAATADIKTQLIYLLVPRFLVSTPFEWLKQFPRYLAGISRRLEKLSLQEPHGGVARDTRLLREIEPYWRQLRIRVEQGTPEMRADPELMAFRWMVEEYRVAVFGADQRTLVSVSPKRLAQQWEKATLGDNRPA